MKAFIIKWVLESIFDLIVLQLKKQAGRSDSDVDDQLVDVITRNRRQIILGIRQNL